MCLYISYDKCVCVWILKGHEPNSWRTFCKLRGSRGKFGIEWPARAAPWKPPIYIVCVELFLTLVPGAFLVGDTGVRTSAQNHRSPVLQRDPNSRVTNQRTRHLSELDSARLLCFESCDVFVNDLFHESKNRNTEIKYLSWEWGCVCILHVTLLPQLLC